jgi:hypothetical protein
MVSTEGSNVRQYEIYMVHIDPNSSWAFLWCWWFTAGVIASTTYIHIYLSEASHSIYTKKITK